jgi:hypothetical protein
MSLIDLSALQAEAEKVARNTGNVLLSGVDCGGFGTGEIVQMEVGKSNPRTITFARVGQQRIPLVAALAIADAYHAAQKSAADPKPEKKKS